MEKKALTPRREIKFKGKRIYNGEWIYGYYVLTPTGQARIYLQPFPEATLNSYYAVDPSTVGEFTGLLDKNGKEIYEGDVVVKSLSTEAGANGAIGVVEWSMVASQWWIRWQYVKNRYSELTPDFGAEKHSCLYLEVVGNLHETPSLLPANLAVETK